MRSNNKRSNWRRTSKASTVACSDRGCPESGRRTDSTEPPPARSIGAAAPADGSDGRSLSLAVDRVARAIGSIGTNRSGQLLLVGLIVVLAAKHGRRAVATYLGSLMERQGAEGLRAAAVLLGVAALLRAREVSATPARSLGQDNDDSVDRVARAVGSIGTNKSGQLLLVGLIVVLAAKHGRRAVATYLGSLMERQGAEGLRAAAVLLGVAALLRAREVSATPARSLGQDNDDSDAASHDGGVRERKGQQPW